MSCAFCSIAKSRSTAELVYSSPELLAFVDTFPIRSGHIQIIPKAHYEAFDDLPETLAASVLHLGQRIARAQKRIYNAPRVGFVFSGHDVPHVHAHLIPLHDRTDLTSMRYFALGSNLPHRDLTIDPAAAAQTADLIGEALK